MKRSINRTTVSALVLMGTIAVIMVAAAGSAFGQSPMFPSVRPVQRNPTRFFLASPDGSFQPIAPVFETQVYAQPVPYFRPRRLPNREIYGPGPYPHIGGYGSSPYVRNYGGAGSSFPNQP